MMPILDLLRHSAYYRHTTHIQTYHTHTYYMHTYILHTHIYLTCWHVTDLTFWAYWCAFTYDPFWIFGNILHTHHTYTYYTHTIHMNTTYTHLTDWHVTHLIFWAYWCAFTSGPFWILRHISHTYGVATVSRIDKIIGLFCKRDL